ncbi:MAG: cobalt ECF transporter T component CbiQ [Caldicoprobacter sp.]|uniref:cobalt ECF transporter T component CbiQ n=1 Tax=Caldicoprobacter sp. TaxID=2004500 RepID=UPI000471EF8A|nr:cobalt ECF transporter T component CbiQ [Clostridia bacterium]
MSNITNSLYDIGLLDDLARKKTFIHRIHPVMKLLTTIVYIVVLTSFEKHEVSAVLPFVFYPVFIISFAEIPVVPVLKRVLLVQPLIIGIGILNPLFDTYIVMLGNIAISRGWLTFLSILIKSSLVVMVSILLVATTGMDRVAVALRMLKIPKVFVLQLLLMYRYIWLLIEEGFRMAQAYSLRAPGQKGIKMNDLGSFLGQMLLRAFDRAQRVYQAMNLRGFTGEYNAGDVLKVRFRDVLYFVAWSLFFVIARIYNIAALIGALFTGVGR